MLAHGGSKVVVRPETGEGRPYTAYAQKHENKTVREPLSLEILTTRGQIHVDSRCLETATNDLPFRGVPYRVEKLVRHG